MNALVRGVTVYMIVIEGTLALTGARFIIRTLKEMDLLPGFRQGFTAVNRDESRHVGFGVKFLADAIKEDERHKQTIQDTLQETLPVGTLALAPPMVDDPYDFETPFGYTLAGDLRVRDEVAVEEARRDGHGARWRAPPERRRRAGPGPAVRRARASACSRPASRCSRPRATRPDHRQGGGPLGPEQGADLLPLRLQAGPGGGGGPRGVASRSPTEVLGGHRGRAAPWRSWSAACSTGSGG